MLSLQSRTGPAQQAQAVRPLRHWKAASAADAAALVRSGSTVAVGWLGDAVASALRDAFRIGRSPHGLTVVYAATHGDGRTHGLNMLAEEGLVRRVVGGQWHPVPGLHALAMSNRIQAYSLPVGVINRLFRDIANGLSGHLSRSGIGTSTDPRYGGGRLNRISPDDLVRLVHAAGEEALLFPAFPVDVALVGVAFMEGSADMVMTPDAMAMANAAHKSGGIVIAQTDRIGTLDKLPASHVVVPDTLVDVLVAADPRERGWETFASGAAVRSGR